MKSYYQEVVDKILEGGIVKATKFVSPKEIVRGVRRRFGKDKKFNRGNMEIILTIGKPNYVEREFIKQCRKNQEAFPLKGVLIKLCK